MRNRLCDKLSRVLVFILLVLLCACGQRDAESLMREGHVLYEEKKFGEAIAVYSKVVLADPRSVDALMCRGLTKSMTGDWNGCVEDLNAAVALDPKNMKLLNARAFAFLHIDTFEKAKDDFRAIDSVEKDAGEKAQFMMAQNLLQRARRNARSDAGDRAKALEDYNRVFSLVPPNDIILFERACVFVDLGKLDAALNDLDRVVKIDGDVSRFGDTHAKRAKVRRSLGDEAGAVMDEAESHRRAQ